MVFLEIPRLETPRLILRKLRLSDTEDYFARLGSSPDVTKGLTFEPHKDISESVASIEKALRRYEAGGCYRWAVALPQDDRIIGVMELLKFDEERETCSFAYMFGKDYWGQGYGTEALRAAMEFAFTRLGVRKIEVDHFSDNPASGAVMRKVGMKYVGTIPGKYEKSGEKKDAVCYSMTKEQFLGTGTVHP